MKMYPFKLRAVPKSILWGGDKLKKLYNKKASFEKIAESWELTVRDDGMSVIENGEFSNITLSSVIENYPHIMGTDLCGSRFPLLIKLIDAADDLSIQVHPNNEYASLYEKDSGKCEMWYILEADEGAEIIYGVRPDTDEKSLHRAITDSTFDGILEHIKVSKGEVYFIPAGQIHALCRGTLIAEIQQNSNITYRIYDYDRKDKDGKKRELHIKKALDTVKCYSSADIGKRQFSSNTDRRKAPNGWRTLADCDYFRVSAIDSQKVEELTFTVDESAFASLLFTYADDAKLKAEDFEIAVMTGDSFFIPAGIGKLTLSGSFSVILSEP